MKKSISHKCHFHPQFRITKFCLNINCTLPLCEKCLPIHTKQHLQDTYRNIGNSHITNFDEATEKALNSIMKNIQQKRLIQKKITKKVQQLRQQIIQEVNKKFRQIQNTIKHDQMQELEQKYQKIKKGSLKSLIYFYSEDYQDEIKLNNKSKNKQIEQVFIQNIRSLFSSLSQLTDNCNFNTTPKKPAYQRVKTEVDSPVKKHLKYQEQQMNNALKYSCVQDQNTKRLNEIKTRNNIFSQQSQQRASLNQNKQINKIKKQESNNKDLNNKEESYRNYSSVKLIQNKAPQDSERQNRSTYFERSKVQAPLRTMHQSVSLDKITQIDQSNKLNFNPNVKNKKPYHNNQLKQNLQNIRKKYMNEGDISVQSYSSNNILRSISQNQVIEEQDQKNSETIRQSQEEDKLKDTSKAIIKLDNKILSKEQIRLNIERRIASFNPTNKLNIKKQIKKKEQQKNNKQTYTRKRAQVQQINEFTLNANGNQSLKDRYGLSSIKKQEVPGTIIGHSNSNSFKKQNQQEYDFYKNRNRHQKQISDFVIQKSYRCGTIVPNQSSGKKPISKCDSYSLSDLKNNLKLSRYQSNHMQPAENEKNQLKISKAIVDTGNTFRKNSKLEQNQQSVLRISKSTSLANHSMQKRKRFNYLNSQN